MARDAVRALRRRPGHRGHPAGLQAARTRRGPDGDRRQPGHPGGRGLPGHVRAGRPAARRAAGRPRWRAACVRARCDPRQRRRRDPAGAWTPMAEARDRAGLAPAARGARVLLRRHALLRGAGDPQPALGPVYSNTPLRPGIGLPAPAGAHICLDLGEEEYTQGRPHPMIDPAARLEILRASRRPARTSRRCCSTSSSATARTPIRPGCSPGPAPTSWPAGPRSSATCSAPARTRRDSTGSAPRSPKPAHRHRERGPGGAGRGRDRACRQAARAIVGAPVTARGSARP